MVHDQFCTMIWEKISFCNFLLPIIERFNGYDRSIRRPLSVQGLLAQHLGVLAQKMIIVGRWIWWKLGAIYQWANVFLEHEQRIHLNTGGWYFYKYIYIFIFTYQEGMCQNRWNTSMSVNRPFFFLVSARGSILPTPRKLNMKSENTPLEKEHHLSRHHFRFYVTLWGTFCWHLCIFPNA